MSLVTNHMVSNWCTVGRPSWCRPALIKGVDSRKLTKSQELKLSSGKLRGFIIFIGTWLVAVVLATRELEAP